MIDLCYDHITFILFMSRLIILKEGKPVEGPSKDQAKEKLPIQAPIINGSKENMKNIIQLPQSHQLAVPITHLNITNQFKDAEMPQLVGNNSMHPPISNPIIISDENKHKESNEYIVNLQPNLNSSTNLDPSKNITRQPDNFPVPPKKKNIFKNTVEQNQQNQQSQVPTRENSETNHQIDENPKEEMVNVIDFEISTRMLDQYFKKCEDYLGWSYWKIKKE